MSDDGSIVDANYNHHYLLRYWWYSIDRSHEKRVFIEIIIIITIIDVDVH